MTGACEFLDLMKQEIAIAIREGGEPEEIAVQVERRLRASFGSARVYIPALPDVRKTKALKLLSSGVSPDRVADRLSVHRSTLYRWRKTGLGREDWVL